MEGKYTGAIKAPQKWLRTGKGNLGEVPCFFLLLGTRGRYWQAAPSAQGKQWGCYR